MAKEKKTASMRTRGIISDTVVHIVLAALSILWIIPFSIFFASIMHQYTQSTNMISMKIFYLKIINLNRFFCQLNIKIFN